MTSRYRIAIFLLYSAVLRMLALSSNKLSLCGQKGAIAVPGFLLFKLQFQLETAGISFPEIPEVSLCFFGFAWVMCRWGIGCPNSTCGYVIKGMGKCAGEKVINIYILIQFPFKVFPIVLKNCIKCV